MTKEELINDFVQKMLDYDKFIAEKQAIDAKNKQRNLNAWNCIEARLENLQPNYRSQAFDTYKAYSVYFIPMGEQLLNKLISEMTDDERKILNK